MNEQKQPTTTAITQADEQAVADAAYDKIRRRAYDIWEKEGRPTGRQHEHWAQAEREILTDAGIAAGPGTLERQ